jgi:hypothetical protein
MADELARSSRVERHNGIQPEPTRPRHIKRRSSGVPHRKMVFSLFGPTLVNLVAFLYPAYCAHKALAASKGKEEKTADVRKWLCYFTTIALVSQVEFVTSWLPGYYLFKFVGVLYLVLPQFNGIETVYTKFVEPFLVQHEKTIDDVLEKARAAGAEKMTELSAKVMSAVASTAKMGLAADAAAPAAAPAAAEGKKDE